MVPRGRWRGLGSQDSDWQLCSTTSYDRLHSAATGDVSRIWVQVVDRVSIQHSGICKQRDIVNVAPKFRVEEAMNCISGITCMSRECLA